MFTLYEVAFKGTEDRLFLTASKEEAIQRRAELRAEYAAAGSREVIVARRVITPDYWICEGTVFDDIADLYEAYPESDATVIHMTTASLETYRYAHGHATRLAAEAAEAASKTHDQPPARKPVSSHPFAPCPKNKTLEGDKLIIKLLD